jgi:hypothetical protein
LDDAATLVDVADISNAQYQTEIAEFQNNESVKAIFKLKGAIYNSMMKQRRKIRLQLNLQEKTYYLSLCHI